MEATNEWYLGIEKEISSLKEKMAKGDYSAYELDSLLRVAKRISSLSDECSQCAESKTKITNAVIGLRDWPNTSKEQKESYILIFRTTVNHFGEYHTLTKGSSMKVLRNISLIMILVGIIAMIGASLTNFISDANTVLGGALSVIGLVMLPGGILGLIVVFLSNVTVGKK